MNQLNIKKSDLSKSYKTSERLKTSLLEVLNGRGKMITLNHDNLHENRAPKKAKNALSSAQCGAGVSHKFAVPDEVSVEGRPKENDKFLRQVSRVTLCHFALESQTELLH